MVNQATINLIKSFESCSLKAYDDRQPLANIADSRVVVVGILTIGYGHTGPDVKRDSVITQQQAEDLLAQDLLRAEKITKSRVYVRLNPNQYGALVDFVFNCGGEYFSRKRHEYVPYRLWLLVNSLADEPLLRSQWRKTAVTEAGVFRPGLLRRRQAEADLFFSPIT